MAMHVFILHVLIVSMAVLATMLIPAGLRHFPATPLPPATVALVAAGVRILIRPLVNRCVNICVAIAGFIPLSLV